MYLNRIWEVGLHNSLSIINRSLIYPQTFILQNSCIIDDVSWSETLENSLEFSFFHIEKCKDY